MKNFYEGFEGEQELVVSLKGGHERTFSAWIGYFDTMMDCVECGKDGWEGIALHYHRDTGFYDGVWRDPNPTHTVETLRSVLPRLAGLNLEFAEQFLGLAERAAKSGYLELEIC